MLPHQKTAVGAAFALGFCALLCSPAAALDRRPSRVSLSPEAERHYQAGMQFYVAGSKDQALSSFRQALRLSPQDPSARAAVNRLEVELMSPPPTRPEQARPDELGEDPVEVFAAQVVDFVRFEETLGDARSKTGTLEAMQGRVAQLLAERKRAKSKGLAFAKERELRAMVRRLPAVLA